MPALRFVASVAAALCIGAQGAKTAVNSSSCSTDELQQVQTLIAEIRASLESDAASSNEATSVPSTCKAALTFDLSVTSEDEVNCANDCVAWIESVVDAPTCGDEEMPTYQRRMAAYLAQCNERKRVRLQETDGMEHSSRLRGLAAGSPEERKLGVKGLMDALLVVTLNNAL
ncbi:hypothetical protein KRP22_013373 [Phytophthora ramorum]|nr:hypothetical protein KRP22_11459 [Phytophthora ramorum]